jgi:hypothetical protein
MRNHSLDGDSHTGANAQNRANLKQRFIKRSFQTVPHPKKRPLSVWGIALTDKGKVKEKCQSEVILGIDWHLSANVLYFR